MSDDTMPIVFDPYADELTRMLGPSNGATGHVAPAPGQAKEAKVIVIRRRAPWDLRGGDRE